MKWLSYTIAEELNGYVGLEPNLRINLGHMANYKLQIVAHSNAEACDPIVLVNDSAGHFHYNDDQEDSTNSKLILDDVRDGVFDIWVGSFAGAACTIGLDIRAIRNH